VATSSAPCRRGCERISPSSVVAPGDVHLHDRAEPEERLDARSPVVVLQRDRVAAAAELLEHGEEVVRAGYAAICSTARSGRTGGGRDLDEEVAGNRHPRRVAAGEDLEADVAERVDKEGGRRLGVGRGVERLAGAAEQQLVPEHLVAVVGDGLADDGVVGAAAGGSARTLLSPHGRQGTPIVGQLIHIWPCGG
jgi:hypothetical protein